MKRIIIIILFLTLSLLSGCTESNETGTWVKTGKVIKIEYDDVFGGTFTDWRDVIYFADGTVLWSQKRDLSSIILNRTGRFYFDKNYFKYEGVQYKFDNFKYVEWYENEYENHLTYR